MSSNQRIQFLNDGGCYEGEYKDGKYHGQGTETWSDGDKYEGEFKHELGLMGTSMKENGRMGKNMVKGF